ncbi:ski2-like helicase [Novipirellula aureliae]|uniref:Ski2-like helicase n=1 Tax=Novipirellula aureliae TaxID=2527966 RepID=A0A5C6E8R7_9BACT|nr:DEAD/DEAH box helicase [Novipirellula aureliae]TWU44925.1 ski2-like helicase [Novipirellula aureliae]
METSEALVSKLTELCASGVRDRLVAKGLSRGMIWKDGTLPEDSPKFSSRLTNDLLNHGYLVLGCAIRLRILAIEQSLSVGPVLDDGFRTAAECIEAVVRRGQRQNDRGFHLTIAAAAFHLAHYGARSYSLLAENTDDLNLVDIEVLLVALMQRKLDDLESLCLNWLVEDEHTDEGIVSSLESGEVDFDDADAAYVAICQVFHRAVANFDFGLRSGESAFVEAAIEALDRCIEAAEEIKHVPLWWICIVARHLMDDLWSRSLHQTLPVLPNDDRWEELRSNFIDLLCQRSVAEIDLWPSQIAAASRVVDESDSLVVALPTSSGKTRIAELCILKCLASGRRVIYVTPLRALSAQVEGTLARSFRPLGFSVSCVYGASGIAASDVDTMRSASIVVATPEKLDFAIRQASDVIDDVGLIVLDEGHMIGLNEREIRYEVLVQRLLQRSDASNRRMVCLSAIFTEGDPFDAFTQWIRADKDGEAIQSKWRPTRQRPATLEWKPTGGWLEYQVSGETVFVPRFIEEQPKRKQRHNAFPQNRNELIFAAVQKFHQDGHAVLLYCPLRTSVETAAALFLKLAKQGYVQSYLTPESASEIGKAIRIGEEWLGANHVAIQALRLGIAVHHGQLPRPFLAEIEALLRRRVLTVAISSPTLAQGVDLSFGVLIFSSLWRNGEVMKPKEFANVVGRVGRAFVDLDGIYVLPVHEDDTDTRDKRLSEFHKLVRDARGRELESGLYLLIHHCLRKLQNKLGIASSEMAEYVLNQQPAIDEIASTGNDLDARQIAVMLAEFDAGIYALVEDLDCDISEVAAKLDEALKSSLWLRRLAIQEVKAQENQIAMLRGRAIHNWSRTTAPQRKGFFSASIGTESGLQIVDQADELGKLLDSATAAIKSGDTEQLSMDCCELANILFVIYPFRPKFPKVWSESDWKAILDAWISGATLHRVTDTVGIAFVQQSLVFQLVWAIEAARTVLASIAETKDDDETSESEDERTYVAICITYGVPSVAAARMLEIGMESRLLAVRLAKELALTFTTRTDLLIWLLQCDGVEPLLFSETEREVWLNFVQRNEFYFDPWQRRNELYKFRLGEGITLAIGTHLRLQPNDEGTAELYMPDFQWVGRTDSKVPSDRPMVGVITSDGEVCVRDFVAPELPDWLKTIRASS